MTINLVPSCIYRLDQDPRRAPDWRCQRVRELLNGPVRNRPVNPEEDFVEQAAKFVRRYEAAPGRTIEQQRHYRRSHVYPLNPGLYYAWELFLGVVPGAALEAGHIPEFSVGDNSDRFRLRTVVEACVLARMTPLEIGNSCSLFPEAVKWYERLFYDVRSRLGCSHWVRAELIGNVVLKRFAFEGGPRILEEVLSGYDRGITPPSPGESSTAYWCRQFESSVARRSATTIEGPSLSIRDDIQLFRYMSALSNRQAAVTDDDRRTNYLDNIRVFIEDIKIMTGSKGLAEWRKLVPEGHFEPRVSDLMRAAVDPKAAAELKEAVRRPLNRVKQSAD